MAEKIIAPPKGLTDVFIKSLKVLDIRYEIADKACSGLRVRIGTTGKKSFVWIYKDPETEKLKKLTLGRYGTGDNQLTLSAARKALETAKVKHAAGELNTVSNVPTTIHELCEIYFTSRIVPHLRRPEAIRQTLDHDIIPILGKKQLKTISTVAVVNCVQVVVKRGAVAHAGKVTAVLKQMFKFAEGRGYIDRSPAYALDKKDLGVVLKKRDRWLQTEEIKPVWNAINDGGKMSLPVKNALKVLMMTGVRTGELLKARWGNINFDSKEWLIPKENTKTYEEWIVPLTDEVITLLEELQGIDPVYVFAGKNGALTDKTIGRAMRRLFETGTLSIDRITPHDFRRTIRTHLERLNVPPHIAEKCLNHSLGAINSVYNKNAYLPERRKALSRWCEFVLMQVTPQPNVTHIGRGG